MENEVKVEKKTIKGFIMKHRAKITLISVIAGYAAVTVVSKKVGLEPKFNRDTVIEGVKHCVLEEGYDVWAMVNGEDLKAIAFGSTLQDFAKNNGVNLMWEIV